VRSFTIAFLRQKPKSIGDAILDMVSTEKYAVDALLYALVR